MRAILLKLIPLLLIGSAALAQPAGGAHYQIDLSRSDIHWLVYKAGTLSRLGHNHVISVGELSGDVYVAPNLADSRLEITIPVEKLVVDDPALRAKEGEDFSSVPSAKDIEGTKHNMLSPKVLDAENYETIKIAGTGPVGAPGSQELHLTIDILGRSVQVTVPTEVHVEGDTVEAAGKFKLTHEALGMTPFSVALGALQVANEMSFSYRVVAHRAE
ncbi:MAG TPA: YceI family protein [Gammaproteobacteria bacterium]|nr:YceI family protein [Gammaproteobacteria bacterium]